MPEPARRPTIGVLINWPAYHGTTMRGYLASLLRGIYITADELGCNVLFACDIEQRTYPACSADTWPASASAHFLPVGPWNTDGLIVVADALSEAQQRYLEELRAARHPVVFAGFPGVAPAVVADNAGGVRQALEHLFAHGHTRIAFIAGFAEQAGDSMVRLQAYREGLDAAGIAFDPDLVAYGQSRVEPARRAMRQILDRGAPFTAVLANNDSSCIGAMEELRAAGRRIPEDVAVIGFDDILEGRALTPPLTTVRHPTFALGRHSLGMLLELIAGRAPDPPALQIPTRLVIRSSCGCRPGADAEIADLAAPALPAGAPWAELARTMASATLLEAQTSPALLEDACLRLLETFVSSVAAGARAPFLDVLAGLLGESEAQGEDPYAWQAPLSLLRHSLPALLAPQQLAHPFAEDLLDQARQVIAERVRRQATHSFLSSLDSAEALGFMTAELLAALDEAQISAILAEYLPRVGVRHLQVARFDGPGDDPSGQSALLLSCGLAPDTAGLRFATRQFPPPGLYPPDRAFQLAVLPLAGQPETDGFVVFEAANLEPCAVIARNLAAALRSSQLHAAADAARRQAEEASRLKSRFLSMVSHELRTPLGLIVGLSEMLLREQEQGPALPERTLQDITQISRSAQHLGRLIGDVLDLASSEAGQLRLLLERLDLCEVLGAVAQAGAQMAREKQLAWQVQMPDAGVWVLGDRTRLRQVALNLIGNAVKFTASGAVRLELICAGGSATVAISDTGLGVPLAEQSRIFDEFQRSEQAVARGYGGLGLGLAICKQLIERHGGTIGVHSAGEAGQGATFFFTLSLLADAPDAPEPAERPVAVLTEWADEAPALVAYLAGRGLAAQVYQIDVETDWLQRLSALHPGAIVVDAQLAARQGGQILAALQRHPATEPIPLLVCSIDAQQQQAALLELQYQRKPLDIAQIRRVLDAQSLLGAQQAGARTILVVDDDPATRAFHTRLLQQQPARYRVLQARDGREALELMQETRPDLVLLDLLMPELDGFGVLEAMRASEPLRDVPVVVLTAQTLTDSEMDRLSRGLTAILGKGLLSTDEIAARIEAVLARAHTLGGPTQQIVHRALAYIHSRYAEPLARSDIARAVGIDEDYLTDCFHQRVGVPPMAYLNRYRIRQARELLAAGGASITEVALAVGFSDSAHFSRVFQREVGISPSAYRRGQRAP